MMQAATRKGNATAAPATDATNNESEKSFIHQNTQKGWKRYTVKAVPSKVRSTGRFRCVHQKSDSKLPRGSHFGTHQEGTESDHEAAHESDAEDAEGSAGLVWGGDVSARCVEAGYGEKSSSPEVLEMFPLQEQTSRE